VGREKIRHIQHTDEFDGVKNTLTPEKLAKLHDTDTLFVKKYGEKGTATREAFEEKAIVNYYSEIFKDKRKELKITQTQLAKSIGKRREYITLLEKGKTDMQLSTFFSISNALGLKFTLA
jgi:DNA-binding XRE family transcriptional regulator